jgi:hypothetical protein
MNIVSSCQGANLTIFIKLLDAMACNQTIDKVGIFTSDSMSFYKQQGLNLNKNSFTILKEWEVFSKGRAIEVNFEILEKYEKKVGDPVLWNALLADRRIFFGKKCKMKQDYKSRYSYSKMMGILQNSLEEIDQLFKDLKPDLVISFGMSNLGDYLFYLFAKANNIAFLQLKATKMSNRVSFNDDAIELSLHIKDCFLNKDYSNDVVNQAKAYIEEVKDSGVKYEGAILQKNFTDFRYILISLLKGCYASIRKNLSPIYRNDNHLESYFLLQFRDKVANPVKYLYQEFRLKKNILTHQELKNSGRFVFYPLHFEPEVSIQVFGKGYQNQIELIRNIALSLPIGIKLLVKEHPRSKGFRNLRYYQKILEIPNVKFIKADISTNVVVKYSTIVAVISGSTGLEAAIIGRPVMTFGKPVYNILPNNMVRYISDINNLDFEIKSLLKEYNKDNEILVSYLAAIIQGSTPVDLYTALLGKEGRFSGNGNDSISSQYDMLASYLNKRIAKVVFNNK